MSLNNTTVAISLASGETNSFGATSPPVNFTDAAANTSIANGTGNLQAQRSQYVKLNPATGGGTTYDLTNFATADSGTQKLGLDNTARNYTGIKWIKLENLDANNAVTIQPGAANGIGIINGATTGNPLTLNPGDVWCRYFPNTAFTVDGTHKTILITASAGTPIVACSILGLGT